MTSKNGGRKNLGTVVELAETGDDCTSPLIADSSEPSSTNAPTVSAEGSRSSSINLAQAGSLTNTVTDDPTAGATDSMHDVESLGGYPRTFDLTSPSGFAAASSSNFQAAQQPMPPRKRLGPLAQTRIGIFNLLNSVTVAGRSLNNRSRNSTSSATPAPVNVIKTSTTTAAAGAAASSHASGDSKSRNPDSDIEAGPISDDEDGSENFFDMAPAEVATSSLRRKSNSSFNEDETIPSSSMDAPKVPLHPSVGKFCALCCMRYSRDDFPKLRNCAHRSCQHCLSTYLTIQIMESRVKVTCPECTELMHPNDITYILRNDPRLLEKYESFTLRRTLLNDPDARWCPAPDCGYAVIASYCAACPQLECQRPGCNTKFCYHCQSEWHDRLTCNEALKVRNSRNKRRSIAATSGRGNGGGSSGPSFLNPRESILKPGDVKACPRCRTFIVKVDDGSCNHMVCAMCGAEFCWLCLKIITDLHYLSPTGCTFWGKRPWTRKKKLLWQIGTLIGAPVGIALIAGLAVPGIIFGVPVFVGRKTYQRFPQMSRIRRRVITAATVAGALVVSPVLAVMAVGVGVPIMLAYVYGVVPLSLCRNGGCGGGENGPQSPYGEEESPAESVHRTNLENDLNSITDPERSRLLNADGTSVGVSVHSGLSSEVASHRYNRNCRVHVQDDGTSRRRPSIDSGVTSLGERGNFDGASVNAMAGSHYDKKSVHTVYSDGQEAQYDEAGSTKALAGSVFDAKSLTDSVGRHGVVFRDEKAPTSSTARPLKISTSHPSVYPPPVPDDVNECCCSELSANGAKPDEQHEGPSSHAFSSRLSTSMDAEEGQVDPYKVHAFMDNIKQILNDEAADEPPSRPMVMKTFKKNPALAHPPSSSTARHLRQPGITRTSSTKSGGTTVSAQVSEEGAHVVITPTAPPTIPEPEETNRMPSTPPTTVLPRHSTPPSRRPSFFARLFRRNKPST
uniref:RBR-type E3 ubiquitin transferase n=1 Tax=Panagrellus redivivus TaxID=6233 RepID=A0A7E4UXU2_PANRE